MPILHDVEGDVNTLRRRNARVDFVLQPVLGNFPLHTLHVPGEAHAKIAAAAGKTESTFRAARAEIAIRPTDRAAFSEGNLVGLLLRFGLWQIGRASCREGGSMEWGG